MDDGTDYRFINMQLLDKNQKDMWAVLELYITDTHQFYWRV